MMDNIIGIIRPKALKHGQTKNMLQYLQYKDILKRFGP